MRKLHFPSESFITLSHSTCFLLSLLCFQILIHITDCTCLHTGPYYCLICSMTFHQILFAVIIIFLSVPVLFLTSFFLHVIHPLGPISVLIFIFPDDTSRTSCATLLTIYQVKPLTTTRPQPSPECVSVSSCNIHQGVWGRFLSSFCYDHVSSDCESYHHRSIFTSIYLPMFIIAPHSQHLHFLL